MASERLEQLETSLLFLGGGARPGHLLTRKEDGHFLLSNGLTGRLNLGAGGFDSFGGRDYLLGCFLESRFL